MIQYTKMHKQNSDPYSAGKHDGVDRQTMDQKISYFIKEIKEKCTTTAPQKIETTAWDVIAQNNSPDWVSAKTALHRAENTLHTLNKPENRPLGLIGCALAAEEINSAIDMHDQALTHFIIVDEALRQREDLQLLLLALTENIRMMNESILVSRETEALADKFATVSIASPPQKGLMQAFGAFAKKLTIRPAPRITRPSAPSSPGI